MTFRTIVVFTVGLVCIACGQTKFNPKETQRVSRSLNYGNWVGRRVLSPQIMKQVGLSDEQAQTLREKLDVLEAQSRDLDKTINQAALQQAEIAKRVLIQPGASVDEIMDIIEKIGKLRTEQAKLSTQMLVVIRDNLTDEQRVKMNEVIVAEGKKRIKERAARREHEERNGNMPPPNRPDMPKGW